MAAVWVVDDPEEAGLGHVDAHGVVEVFAAEGCRGWGAGGLGGWSGDDAEGSDQKEGGEAIFQARGRGHGEPPADSVPSNYHTVGRGSIRPARLALTPGRGRAYHDLVKAFVCAAALGLILCDPALIGAGAGEGGQVSAAQADAQTLGRLLALAADYCARLSRASIDFICLEDVSETIHDRAHGWPSQQFVTVEHNYLYDYQFIVENGQKTEKRLILERDGLKKKAEATDLDTRTFYYKNVLFGAVDLLAGSRQSFYRYELKGREVQDGQAVAVIDAVPSRASEFQINQGTIWLRESDAAILKIVWNVRSMENSAAILKTAQEDSRAPLRSCRSRNSGSRRTGSAFRIVSASKRPI